MIIMKTEYTTPGKSLLEFTLFIKFIISHKRRQIELTDRIYMTFSSLFLGVQSAPEVGPTSYDSKEITFVVIICKIYITNIY